MFLPELQFFLEFWRVTFLGVFLFLMLVFLVFLWRNLALLLGFDGDCCFCLSIFCLKSCSLGCFLVLGLFLGFLSGVILLFLGVFWFVLGVFERELCVFWVKVIVCLWGLEFLV